MSTAESSTDTQRPPILRCLLGGTLMGLANLVPGISGGTMLLAAGVYRHFINAIADLTAFRFKPASIVTISCIISAVFAAILFLAGPVKALVIDHRWAAYALFIGLTLGGVPLVWKLLRPATPGAVIGSIIGFVGMAVLAIIQAQQPDAVSRDGYLFMFLAGIAGASAMILPGVSGGYLFLVLGVYVPFLGAIDQFKTGVLGLSVDETLRAFPTLVPVGLGVLVGVVGVSNLLKLLLTRVEKPTLGLLLGLLLGAIVGLYPFQQTITPEIGDTLKGASVTAIEERTDDDGNAYMVAVTKIKEVEREDWPTEYFAPNTKQIAGAIGLILLGIFITAGISRLDPDQNQEQPNPSTNS
ncbi:MAG: DUF368 domain-containing protein [Planctomycetota bacterium]